MKAKMYNKMFREGKLTWEGLKERCNDQGDGKDFGWGLIEYYFNDGSYLLLSIDRKTTLPSPKFI